MKPTSEKEMTEQTHPEVPPAPKPEPLSLEAAELILDGILTDCGYDEWAVDGMPRLIYTFTHAADPVTFCYELVKRV